MHSIRMKRLYSSYITLFDINRGYKPVPETNSLEYFFIKYNSFYFKPLREEPKTTGRNLKGGEGAKYEGHILDSKRLSRQVPPPVRGPGELDRSLLGIFIILLRRLWAYKLQGWPLRLMVRANMSPLLILVTFASAIFSTHAKLQGELFGLSFRLIQYETGVE